MSGAMRSFRARAGNRRRRDDRRDALARGGADEPGSPQRPLRPDEVAAKFAMNAGRTLPADQVEVVRDAVWDLVGATDASTMVHSLRAARRLR